MLERAIILIEFCALYLRYISYFTFIQSKTF